MTRSDFVAVVSSDLMYYDPTMDLSTALDTSDKNWNETYGIDVEEVYIEAGDDAQ